VRTSTLVMMALPSCSACSPYSSLSHAQWPAEMRMRNLEAQKKPAITQTIVVATSLLRFGNGWVVVLREVTWPEEGTAGRRIPQHLRHSWMRAGPASCSLPSIRTSRFFHPRSPGPAARDALGDAAGCMRAVTIRSTTSKGVAGFVLPGDRVDVALTRQKDANGNNRSQHRHRAAEYARSSAIDQIAD